MGLELYKHNKKAYEKVEAMFEHENHVAIVHATGTGKSFISMKWLFDNKDKKCLFLAPTYEIHDQFEEHVKSQGLSLKKDFPNLQFAIYSNLMRKSDKDLKKLQVDNIVLDEFHRCGAPEWSKSINKVIGYNADAKVLGISATPIRYLDNNKNMAEELFHGNIASEITLVDAIRDGILPMPTYISAAYSFEKDIERIQDKINRIENIEEKKSYEEQLKDAKRMLEKSEGLSTVFEKHIPNKEGKYVVFCRDQKHMQQMMQEAKDWLKNVNSDVDMYSVYSGQGRKANKRNLADFNKSKNHHIKLLFSIEMLNEGVHVPDIDGVIMLRPTESKIIYLQQLGRALSVGHNQHPVIFDIVNNIHGTDSIREIYREIKNGGRDAEGHEINLDEFKIIDYLQQPNELIDSLNSLLDDAISPEAICEKIVQAVINFINDNKRMPSVWSKDKDEARLYERFTYHKTKFTEEQKQRLIDAGVPANVFLSQEEGIEQLVSAVIDWVKGHDGKMPSGRSNDKDEERLYDRFTYHKTKFTEEQKQRLIDAGVNVFLSQEEGVEQLVSAVIDWVKGHDGKMPSGASNDEDEARLYKRFNYHKTKIIEEQKQRLIDAGVPASVFLSQEGIEQLVSAVIDWVKGHDGKMPSGTSNDKDEVRLYRRFNYHKTKITEEQKQRLIDAGVPANVFLSQEEGIEQLVSDVIDWVKVHDGKMPSSKSNDKDGANLYARFNNNKTKFTEEQKQRLIDAGLNVFLSEEEGIEQLVSDVIDWLKVHNGKMPSGISNDEDEARLYKRFNYNKTKITEEQKQRLIDAGVNVFLSQEEGIEQVVSDVIDWLKVHDGKMPSGKSNDKDEARLYDRFKHYKTKFTEEQKQRLIGVGVPAEKLEKKTRVIIKPEDANKVLKQKTKDDEKDGGITL